MAEAATVLKWGVERRLEFIEFRLFWEGSINRAALVETFGVSVPQAATALAEMVFANGCVASTTAA